MELELRLVSKNSVSCWYPGWFFFFLNSEWLILCQLQTSPGSWRKQQIHSSSLRALLAMLVVGDRTMCSQSCGLLSVCGYWLNSGHRNVIKIFHLCGGLVFSIDECLLIPLQELIDLKMLQCKRVVNGKCSSGLWIMCVPTCIQQNCHCHCPESFLIVLYNCIDHLLPQEKSRCSNKSYLWGAEV